jgi:tetratricopeptide (TPR) repeat protein
VTSPASESAPPKPASAPAPAAKTVPPARPTAAARTRNTEPPQAALDFARRADQALQARDYDSAIRLYQSAVDASPDSSDLVARLNEAKAAKTRADAVAAEILGSPAPGTPGMPDAERTSLLAQADALVAAKLFDQAIAVYDQILAKEPNNPTARQAKTRVRNLKSPKQ